MSAITLAVRDGRITTTSRQIAEHFGKRHDHVLRAIANLECSEEFRAPNFGAAFYTDDQGKPRQEYILTRDGFVFLCMGFTGREAAQWKEKYIAAFNAMEAQLLDREASVPAPAFYWRAEVLAADSTPSVPLPDELQSAINRRAWALSHDAYEILRLHLARRIAHTCEIGNLGTVVRSKALAIIAATTLNSALTPQHLNQLEVVEQLASRMARVAADVRKQLGGAA